jgi:lipopolysaccharide assembly protein A
MNIIRTLFWVVVAVVLVIFAMNNWEPVTIKIWPGWKVLDTKLPALVIGAFLLGMVPMYVMFRASRWSLKRRLESSERSLADLRTMANRPAAVPAPDGSAPLAIDPVNPTP